jgi:hypothetical protein
LCPTSHLCRHEGVQRVYILLLLLLLLLGGSSGGMDWCCRLGGRRGLLLL